MSRYITKEKLDKIFSHFKNKIDVLFINDSEAHREVNLRYISGHIEDATLLLDINNEVTTLIPWDSQLAIERSEVDNIIDISDFKSNSDIAVIETTKQMLKSIEKPVIGVTLNTPYGKVEKLRSLLNADIYSDKLFIDNFLDEIRSTKSKEEIKLLKESCKISNMIVDEMIDLVTNADENFKEIDLALFAETRMRKLGAEGIGFETLVASSKRSWMIHTYPRAHPDLSFKRAGLALIDFGVNARGLTSDVTLPFAFGSINDEMKKVIETVEQAYHAAIDNIAIGIPVHEIAQIATDIIEKAGYSMPHSLGHGIGLIVHDSPFLRSKPTNEIILQSWEPTILEKGMIITIEPGIYPKQYGGFRLENDVIVTKNGPEVVTNSRSVYI